MICEAILLRADQSSMGFTISTHIYFEKCQIPFAKKKMSEQSDKFEDPEGIQGTCRTSTTHTEALKSPLQVAFGRQSWEAPCQRLKRRSEGCSLAN